MEGQARALIAAGLRSDVPEYRDKKPLRWTKHSSHHEKAIQIVRYLQRIKPRNGLFIP